MAYAHTQCLSICPHTAFIQMPTGSQCLFRCPQAISVYSDAHRQSVLAVQVSLVVVGYAVMLKMLLLLQVFPQIDEVMVKPLRLSKDRYEEMKNKEDAARES